MCLYVRLSGRFDVSRRDRDHTSSLPAASDLVLGRDTADVAFQLDIHPALSGGLLFLLKRPIRPRREVLCRPVVRLRLSV